MLPKLDKALEESVCCSECRKMFTYREREAGLEGEGLPVALCCGHKLCFECLRKNTILPTTNDDAQKEPFAFNCAKCGQEQPRPCGRRDQDLVKTFPLDIATIGLLASLENFGTSFLPHLVTAIQSTPMTLQPATTVAFAEQAIDREMKSLEKMNTCNICSSLIVDWCCMSCDSTFCFLCVSQHDTKCAAKSLNLIPFGLNGDLMQNNPRICKPDPSRTGQCIVHEGHESLPKQNVGQYFEREEIVNFSGVSQEIGVLLRFVEELIAATETSISELTNAEQLVLSAHQKDQAAIVAFFGRLQTSATFSTNLLLQKQMENDGKRLSFLRTLTTSFTRQMSQLKFLRTRWDCLVSDFVRLGVDLRREQTAFEEELLSFALWNPNVLLTKRVKMERFLHAVWQKGIPKGLRSCICKSRMELSLSDSELGQSLDALTVSSCLLKPAGILQNATKYEFAEDLPVAATTSITEREAKVVDQTWNFRNCFHVDGLVPRNWFPQFANLIDSSPTLCVVTHVENPPAVFWIRSSHRAGDFSNLVEFLQFFCEDAPFAPVDISPGEIYAVEIQSHKDDAWTCGQLYMRRKLWMRVQILPQSLRKKDACCECRFVDSGHVMTLKQDELRLIPIHIQQLEPCVRRARLSGFVPYYEGLMGKWSPVAHDHFYSWLKIAGAPYIILEDIVDCDQLVVDMWSPVGVQSLKEFLMFCGCGTLDILSAAFESLREGRKALRSLDY